MKRPVRILASILILTSAALLGFPASALSATSGGKPDVTALPTAFAIAPETSPMTALIATAPVRAPALQAPAALMPAAPAVTEQVASSPASPTSTTRTAYVNAMYLAVVPAGQRAALAGHYVLGYNLPGLGCATGCTGLFDGQARSSFNDTFFAESLAYQRNTLAHEAAHAYGFLYFSSYATPSWGSVGGWQSDFNALDRGFVRTYDAEAWAACVAWQETGFNNRVDQITSVCTAPAAALAMAQIP
jgi:hypothetical protein